MKKVLIALAGAALLVPATANATTLAGGASDTCSFNGAAAFQPALTGTPAPTNYHFTGTGKCSGTLKYTDSSGDHTATLSNAPISAKVDSDNSPTLSCGAAEGSGAPGSITFTGASLKDPSTGASPVLGFKLDVLSLGGVVGLHIAGNTSGHAGGEAQFLTGMDAQSTLTACGPTGKGVTSLPFDAVVGMGGQSLSS